MSASSGAVAIPSGGAVKKNFSQQEKMQILQDVYADEEYRKRFLAFAATKYAEENVLFLIAIREVQEASPGERRKLFEKLSAEFLDESSLNEVNLSSKAKRATLKFLDDEDLSSFDLAWKEVEHQVVQNLCNDFLNNLAEAPPGSPQAATTDSMSGSWSNIGSVGSPPVPPRRKDLLEHLRNAEPGSPALEVSTDELDPSEVIRDVKFKRSSDRGTLTLLNEVDASALFQRDPQESLIATQTTPAETHKANNAGFVKPRQFAKPEPLVFVPPGALSDGDEKDL